MLLSRNAFAFLLIVSAAQVQAQNQNPIENLIPQWLPQCFTGLESFNPLSIIECIRDNAGKTCLERMTLEGTITDVVDCVNTTVAAEAEGADNADGDQNQVESFLSNSFGVNVDGSELISVGQLFVGSALACLDPYATCVQETIQTAVEENLDPCLRQTATELVECGRTNSETCKESCNESPPDTENLFGGLSFLQTSTCASIQTNIMNPICSVVSCCEPCVEKVEALIECVINQQLDQVPTVQGQCNDLACPSPQKRERRLGQEEHSAAADRILEADNNANTDVEQCLEFAPGLTGDDSLELSARSTVFMPCVSGSFLMAVDEGTVTTDADTAGSTTETESNTTGSTETESNTTDGKTDDASGGRAGSSVGAIVVIAGAAISMYGLY